MKAKIMISLVARLLAMAGLAHAQDKAPSVYVDGKAANVAPPAHGSGSPAFESLSFWSGPNGQALNYEYGADNIPVRSPALGQRPGAPGCALRFPNGMVLNL